MEYPFLFTAVLQTGRRKSSRSLSDAQAFITRAFPGCVRSRLVLKDGGFTACFWPNLDLPEELADTAPVAVIFAKREP
jgi:hypothetical protein